MCSYSSDILRENWRRVPKLKLEITLCFDGVVKKSSVWLRIDFAFGIERKDCG